MRHGTKAPSILICGRVADDDAFRQDLDTYLSWRAFGVIDRIVFSGWTADRQAPHIADMAKRGIDVVLSDEPVLHGSDSLFQDMKSLHYGLNEFGGEALVLRVPTERSFLNFSIEAAEARFWNSPPPVDGSPFKRRPVILQLFPFQPFFFNDMMFMGLADDLRKLASFDLWYELEHAVLNREQIVHFHPFKDAAPASRAFFRVNPGLVHGDLPRSIALYRSLLGQPLFQMAVFESLKAVRDHYCVGLNEPPAWTPSTAADTLVSLLDIPADVPGLLAMHSGPGNLIAACEAAVDHMLGCPISADEPISLEAKWSGRAVDPKVGAARIIETLSLWDPDLANGPGLPQNVDGIRIIPSRAPMVGAD